ncbi:hypothetical protein [Kribbella sp. NPDC051620]|uniref:hypothetical protein n=1 Tax=Kribbella sp. NPDC051620 TaxID=3364120 RepID=UPI00378EE1BD
MAAGKSDEVDHGEDFEDELDEPRRPKRKIRLRGLEWFPLPEQAAPRHAAASEPAVPQGEEVFFAAAYLLSIVVLPLAISFAAWHPIDMHDFLYGAPAVLAGALPWFMTEEVCDLAGRSHYSFFALRTQVWVQCGGAAPSAVRRLRKWKRER